MFGALDYAHVPVGSLAECNLEYARLARVSQEEEIEESGRNLSTALASPCRALLLSFRQWGRQ